MRSSISNEGEKVPNLLNRVNFQTVNPKNVDK